MNIKHSPMIMSHPKIIASFPSVRILFVHTVHLQQDPEGLSLCCDLQCPCINLPSTQYVTLVSPSHIHLQQDPEMLSLCCDLYSALASTFPVPSILHWLVLAQIHFQEWPGWYVWGRVFTGRSERDEGGLGFWFTSTYPGIPPDSMQFASLTSLLQTSNCQRFCPMTPASTAPVCTPTLMSTPDLVCSLTSL